jgi:dethiobiotin synthase
MTGLFVTGTGTNIGKTVVSAALLCRYRSYRNVAPICYWKPVQTGAPEDDDTAIVKDLAACNHEEICGSGIRLPRALCPHLSAELSGTRIEISEIVPAVRDSNPRQRWLVEGAGGVLVPLNAKEFMADLMSALGLPVVIVASSQLGTINHTLLTLEALRQRSITVAGVILNGEPNPDNRRAIETFGDVAVLGEMPRFIHLTPATLNKWSLTELDPDGHLLPFLERSSV